MMNNIFDKVTYLFSMLYGVEKERPERHIFVLQGGSSSSKTYSICQLILLKCYLSNTDVAVVGESLGSLKIGALSDCVSIIKDSELLSGAMQNSSIYVGANEGIIIRFKNGSKILFRGVGSPSQSGLAAIKGSQKSKAGKRDILFINEANGIDETVANELILRTRDKVFIDFNANLPFWAHHNYSIDGVTNNEALSNEAKAARIEYIRNKVQWLFSNYKHNQYCPPEIVAQLKEYKHTNPMRYNVYTLGRTGSPSDYKLWLFSFVRSLHVSSNEQQKYLPLIFSFDFNHRDMSVCVGQTNEQLDRKAYSRVRAATMPPNVWVNVLDEVKIKEPDKGKSSLRQALETIAQRYHANIVTGNFFVCGDLSGSNNSHLVPNNSWEEIYAFFHQYALRHNGTPAAKVRYFARTITQDANYPAANMSHKTSNEVCNNAIFAMQNRFSINPRCKHLITDCEKAKFADTKNDAYVLYKDSGDHNMNMFDTLRYLLGFVFFDMAK